MRLFVLLIAIVAVVPAHAQQFYGDLTLRPLDGISMEVASAFGFIDKQGRKWEAPVGHKTDGASIPRPLWTVVGSPFNGNYLKAAVIHDVYCDLRSRAWEDVHRVLYDAMIHNGVGEVQAKVMYATVYSLGPRWVVDKYYSCPPGYWCYSGDPTYLEWAVVQPDPNPSAVEDLKDLRDFVLERNPSLAEIRQRADAEFFRGSRRHHIRGKVYSLRGHRTPALPDVLTILEGGGYSARDEDRKEIEKLKKAAIEYKPVPRKRTIESETVIEEVK